MRCGNCQADNPAGAEFCENCGHRLPTAQRSVGVALGRALAGLAVFLFALSVGVAGTCLALVGGFSGFESSMTLVDALAFLAGGILLAGISLFMFRTAFQLWK